MSRFVVVDDKALMFHIVPSYFWTNLIHHLKRKEKKRWGWADGMVVILNVPLWTQIMLFSILTSFGAVAYVQA